MCCGFLPNWPHTCTLGDGDGVTEGETDGVTETVGVLDPLTVVVDVGLVLTLTLTVTVTVAETVVDALSVVVPVCVDDRLGV